MSGKRLALFDLDGTLVNTEEINFKAYKTALALSGIKLDKETFLSWHGKRWDEFLPGIMGTSDMDAVQTIHKKKLGFYKTFIESGELNERLVDMLDAMKCTFRIALVTSASRMNALEILDFHELTDSFERIITGDDVARPKPDPEGFLKAMKYFECGPEDTVIFEDAPTGVEAAKATGAMVHQVIWG